MTRRILPSTTDTKIQRVAKVCLDKGTHQASLSSSLRLPSTTSFFIISFSHDVAAVRAKNATPAAGRDHDPCNIFSVQHMYVLQKERPLRCWLHSSKSIYKLQQKGHPSSKCPSRVKAWAPATKCVPDKPRRTSFGGQFIWNGQKKGTRGPSSEKNYLITKFMNAL